MENIVNKTLSHSKILCQSGSSKFIAAKVHERCGLTNKVQEKIIELCNSVKNVCWSSWENSA